MSVKSAGRVVGFLLAASLSIGCGGMAAAVPSSDVVQSGSVSEATGLSAAETEELADDLEILFTRYIPMGADGKLMVNENAVIEDGFEESLPELRMLADVLNEVDQTSSGSVREGGMQAESTGSFALCVALKGLGVPAGKASSGLIAAIKSGIKAWNWGLTAKTVAKILGASTVKALGGPVAIGVQLAAAAFSCRGEL
ncbi:hypothetical protein [Actinomyces glycerinitolerans]|uniref:Prokaryotic membrane lipoprotein lipid attachment site profile n=1 Tax=Actinomyces glycerinitolerans TaxID=1892869 RepID=A0A1M4S0X1_9ACTO|nr:hypothetical protein [Actinomyces glycerinitolerans]SHE25809.1 Hypothetical protein ACGLYG10_2045 [Actinomyces glycerinitolerans]